MPKSLRRLRFLGKQRPYRVRVREKKNSFRTALLSGRSPKKAAGRSRGGRILSCTKIGIEEYYKIGDFFKLGKQLMEEFRQEERNGRNPSSKDTESRREGQ